MGLPKPVRHDPFTIQDEHGPAPADPNLTPLLIRQASLYPDGRMLPVILKGIPAEQTSLWLPTTQPVDADAAIPAPGMTRAYAEEVSQFSNDLALLGTDQLMSELQMQEPDMIWTERIRSGGLLDIPDENGESRRQ